MMRATPERTAKEVDARADQAAPRDAQ